MRYRISALLILTLVPIFVGLALYFIFKNDILIELSLFIFAIIEFILFMGRANRNDRLNMQEYGTTRVDKTSDEFLNYRRSQRLLLLSILINLCLAYVSFLIFGG